jgi:hypothetical protein
LPYASARQFSPVTSACPLAAVASASAANITNPFDHDILMGDETAHLKHSLSEDEGFKKRHGQGCSNVPRSSGQPLMESLLREFRCSPPSVEQPSSIEPLPAAADMVDALSNIAANVSAEESNEIHFVGEYMQVVEQELEAQEEASPLGD